MRRLHKDRPNGMMRFRKVGNLDVAPVLDRVVALNLGSSRDDDLTVDGLKHKAVPLRLHDNPTQPSFFEDLPVHDLPLLAKWPEMQQALVAARAMIAADPVMGPWVDTNALGRVVFSVIEPQGWIQWHRDTGAYIEATERFHWPLVTTPGAVNYEEGPEELHMEVGDLTWIDNKCWHSAVNWSDAARIHGIFELRCLKSTPEPQ